MQNNVELMCMFWTTAGVYPGGVEISRFDFKDRVQAAARAGFRGMGIWHTDLDHILQYRTLKDMRRILEDNGMEYLELEFLTDWFLEGGRKSESDSRKRRLLEASEALNAKHIKVGDFYNESCPLPKVAEAFSALCEEAAQYGATIGFEIMGCAMIDNLKDAIAMVTMAGADNGGLILDSYQVANLQMSFEEISSIPLKHLVGVELNDGILPGNPGYDPANRMFCGDGEYNLKGLIDCVLKMGYSGPWGVEVIAEKLSALPLKEMSTRSFQTTMAQFSGR